MIGSYLDDPEFLAPTSDESDPFDFSVLTTLEHLRSTASAIDGMARHPISIIDIKRDPLTYINSDDYYDSLYQKSASCRKRLEDKTQLLSYDDIIISILRGLKKDESVEDIEKRIQGIGPSVLSEITISRQPSSFFSSSRPIIRISCSRPGFDEVLFPVFYNGSAIGGVLLGLLISIYHNDSDIINKQNNTHHSNIQEMYITGSDYQLLVSNTNDAVCAFENELMQAANKKRADFIKKTTDDIVATFFSEEMSGKDKRPFHRQHRNELHESWEKFCSAANKLKGEFDLEEVLLFGDGPEPTFSESMTKPVYPNRPANDIALPLKYDYAKIGDVPRTAVYAPLNSFENPELLNGLTGIDNVNNMILIVFPDVVLLLCAREMTDAQREIYRYLTNEAANGFSRIYSAVALSASNFLKERLGYTLRMYRHENSHIASRLGNNLQRYFSNDGQKFLSLNQETQRSVVQDITDTIRSITNMEKTIGIINDSINEKTAAHQETSVDVIKELNKLKSLFSADLLGNNLDIVVDNCTTNPDCSESVLINRDLLELLTYNLIDNAVKYAHRGSNIYICFQKPTIDENCYMLTISNYGPKIDDGDLPYALYYRGASEQHHAVEGDGIGLYVVKRIADILGLSISHECVFLSNYNIPLLSWYLEESEDSTYHAVIDEELARLSDQKDSCDMLEIINNSSTRITRADLTHEYLSKRVLRQTWLTTFTVRIPK